MKKFNLFILILTTISFGLTAQTVEVKGVVKSTTGAILTSDVNISVDGGGPISRAPITSPDEFSVLVSRNSTILFQHNVHEVTRHQVGTEDQSGVQIIMNPLAPDFQAPSAPTDENIDALINDLNTMPTKNEFGSVTPSGDARRKMVFSSTRQRKLADINPIWKRANGVIDIDYQNAIRIEPIFIARGRSNWTATSMMLVAAADQVRVIETDIVNRVGYWDQFKNVYALKDNNVFTQFGLYISQINLGQLDDALEFLDLLNQLGPFIITGPGIENSMLVTGFYHDATKGISTVKYFDPYIRPGARRGVGFKTTTLKDFIFIMNQFTKNNPNIIIATLK